MGTVSGDPFVGKSPINGALRMDEQERKDVSLDFKELGAIEETDSIRSAVWSHEPEGDLTLYGARHDTDRLATVWVTGAKRGKSYRLSCLVQTVGGRTIIESLAICGQQHLSPVPSAASP